ncbi:MAG TPA: ATP-binding protein [Candidatus Saccharimonadales bacterium]|nr:ATP-binding protein [Candidatus Saccharimonadales bacterium]
MTTFLIVLLVLLSLTASIGLAIYFRSRKILREQKNIERGLKMVPLLIHLPPISDDTEIGQRDARDVVEENISKAQVLYNIIASTLQKGFRSKFYGQRHFAFEIVGTHGFVHFYAAVPVVLADVIKQAIVSAYPAAQLEEVAEHNIFSPVGRLSGTLGGELTLKEPFAYPIATYQEIKRDVMQSLLNALSTLDKEDGAGIQILIRPSDPGWRKTALALATKKRKGEDGKSGSENALWWVKQLGTAFVKPPEDKSAEAKKPEISSIDQTVIDAIEDKTRHPGYQVLVRVVASSNISQRAQAILSNIVAAFSLFDAPGKNGFKYTPARDIEDFITAYILRFFPQESNDNILNSVELATMFHFPDEKNIPTSQLERQATKQVDGPRNISEEGLLLGYNIFRGAKKPIRLSHDDRRRHIYTVGQTGTGKSTFLENLALQDMLAGNGFAFVDPHGDTVERLMAMVPKERTEDVIYFCPADMDYPMGLNLFEFHSPDQRDFLIQEAINMLYKLYDPQHQGIIGPRYEHWFRNAALTVMSNPNGGTFIDIPKVFTDKQYERELKQYVTDKTVLDFWDREMAQTSDYHKSEVLGWFVSKFGAFLSNEMMRNIIGQSKSAFNLREVMDNKKILLVNLSKGKTGELNSKLLGMVFIMKFQAAAMSRAAIPEEERSDFCLYVDEFQNFSTDSFASILSEARKYRLNLVVANQFTTQLTDEIRDAVFGNIGSLIAFRVGADVDADALTKKFQPVFERDDILRLPNFNTVSQILVGGVPTQPFSMATLPPLGTPNAQLALALKQLSFAKFGRPKAGVEKEIFARLTPKEAPSRPVAGTSPLQAGMPPPQATGGPPSTRPTTGSSFLDDWLAKRQTGVNSNPRPAPPLANRNSFPASPTISPAQPQSFMPANQAVSPAANGQQQPTVSKTSNHSGEVSIRGGQIDHSDTDNTISIDKDGNLSSND